MPLISITIPVHDEGRAPLLDLGTRELAVLPRLDALRDLNRRWTPSESSAEGAA
ncbi:hypothetical protein [Streptomyces sp. NPDC096012]|uniref:hypothetical protein n=1 Tax=Streptomyces sp. NPDC096012 TaxID=3155684 RepID=UPI00336A7391